MVGGGPGAFIGDVHRKAASLDGQIELVCGVFSSDPEKSKQSGRELYLPDDRVYGSYEEMFEKEKERPEGERMDFVSIVTPNFLHFKVAKAALTAGFHVVCEKPMTLNVEEGEELVSLVEKTGLVFALTHNYTGYPMVKQARHMVSQGELGEIRKIVVEYPQGWLASKDAEEGKQASWRMDPEKAGSAGAMGDIGTHAENLAEYISGLQITELCADLSTYVDGRILDDDGNILLHFDNGAKGVLHASQISVGEENALKIYIYGENGGLEWHQQEPSTLLVKHSNQPNEVYRTGNDNGEYLSDAAMDNTRLPAGHPAGFIEAFGNIYRNAAAAIQQHTDNGQVDLEQFDFPTVQDGLRGMVFLETVIASNESSEKWTDFRI